MIGDVVRDSASNEEQKRVAGQIRELLGGRDTGLDILTREEIGVVLFELCVH